MTNAAATFIVAGTCGGLALAAFVWFIAWPACQSYEGAWERLLAGVMSLYVLLALVLVGVAGGVAVAYYWDRIAA